MNKPETANTQTYFDSFEIWEAPLLPYQKQVQEDILRILPLEINSILDVGCGNGVITNILPEHLRVVGVDISQSALLHVRKEVHVASITALPFEDNSFDLVMANDLLEHLTQKQLEAGILELKRVSSRYLLLTVPFMEDLNLGSVPCKECGRFYHVNHHRTSFDLEKLQNLLGSPKVRCVKNVLSGDRWEGQPPEVVLIKRMLGVDTPQDLGWVCSHCGTPYASGTTVPDYSRLSQFLAHLASNILASNPNLRDLCQAPTEVICLFDQSAAPPSVELEPAAPWAYTDADGKEVVPEKVRLSCRYLDFRQPERYQKTVLPLSGFLPYFYSQHPGPEGVGVSQEKTVLVGFFCRPFENGRSVVLRLKGWAPKDTVMTLAAYDDIFSYHSPVQVRVSGRFAVSVPLPEAAPSKYGMLFSIHANREMTLNRAKLLNATGGRVSAYDISAGTAAFFRLNQAESLFLGLPRQGGGELIHTRWMERPSLLRNNNFPMLTDVDPSQTLRLLHTTLKILTTKLISRTEPDPQLADQLELLMAVMDTATDTDTPETIAPRFEAHLEAYYTAMAAQGRQPRSTSPVLSLKKSSLRKAIREEFRRMRAPNYFQMRSRQMAGFLRRCLWIGPEEPFEAYQSRLIAGCTPELFDYHALRESTRQPTFLMICHDQRIDRRIIQQAHALKEQGWSGRIVCLSFDDEDQIETYEGVNLHRIGKKRLIPMPCDVYWRYQKRHHKIRQWGRNIRFLTKFNWKLYKRDLNRTYRCKNIQYPLPFDLPFYKAGELYPSDLVIAHDLTALKAAHQLSQEWKVPLIYDSHEFYSEQIVFSDYQKQIMDTTERRYAPDCSAVITVSHAIARAMGEKNGIAEPSVILNVTDAQPDLPTVRSRLLHDRLGLPYTDKIVLYQGGIIPRRNVEILLGGFKHLNRPDVHLVMLGPSKPQFLQKLRQMAGSLNNQQVHILQAVPQHELLYYTTSADFGVIPYPPIDLNTRYCMPNKTFEYIQACLPILANDLVEIGRFVKELGGGGMVADLNSERSMAEALRAMLERDLESDRQRLAMIKDRYTWQEEKKRYLAIVEKAMSTHPQKNRDSETEISVN